MIFSAIEGKNCIFGKAPIKLRETEEKLERMSNKESKKENVPKIPILRRKKG